MYEFVSLYIYLGGIACTGLQKALCLILCKKLKIPSKAKPTKPEIIVQKIPLLLF